MAKECMLINTGKLPLGGLLRNSVVRITQLFTVDVKQIKQTNNIVIDHLFSTYDRLLTKCYISDSKATCILLEAVLACFLD